MKKNGTDIPILGIVGHSGSGKTTLLEKIVPKLTALGVRVGVIKHSHHNASVDKKGKDSWRMTESGASQVIMACDERWALMTETPKNSVSLDYLASQFDSNLTDLILVEGFKQEKLPKILLHRAEMDKSLPEIDDYVIAIAMNYKLDTEVVNLDIDNIEQISAFVMKFVQK